MQIVFEIYEQERNNQNAPTNFTSKYGILKFINSLNVHFNLKKIQCNRHILIPIVER